MKTQYKHWTLKKKKGKLEGFFCVWGTGEGEHQSHKSYDWASAMCWQLYISKYRFFLLALSKST